MLSENLYILMAAHKPLDKKRDLGQKPGRRSEGLDGALGGRERQLDGEQGLSHG